MAEATHILKLAGHDEGREIDFELDWHATLSEAQRFELMFTRSAEILRLLEQHGHRAADTIVRRA